MKNRNIDHLPAVFYRYVWDGSDIVKTRITRKKIEALRYSRGDYSVSFAYLNKKGTIEYLTHPERIELGVWDGKRKCVFLEDGDADIDALNIILNHMLDVFADLSIKVTDNINTRNAIRQCIRMKGGKIDYGKNVPV